jgi:hypothetical protein
VAVFIRHARTHPRPDTIEIAFALEPAPPYLATRVPGRSQAAGGPLRVCPECGCLYWRATDVRRMQQGFAAWQQEAATQLTETVWPRSVSVVAGSQRHERAG